MTLKIIGVWYLNKKYSILHFAGQTTFEGLGSVLGAAG